MTIPLSPPGLPRVGDGSGLEQGRRIHPEELQLAFRNHAILLEGLRYDRTPTGMHYTLTHYDVPYVDPATWRLEVGGLVRRPLSLSLSDLARSPPTGVVADFHCVSGWWVEKVRWEGVPLAALLQAAEPVPEARAVRFESLDGAYEDEIDLASARAAGVLIGLRLGGRPLTPERGGPARLVVPFYYGYKSVKWLSRLSLVSERRPGYWEQRGYDSDARIRG
jgi:DMSO/TMAO reductase YedYZ molybdopterin-dependent catalytic subunit